jgi:peptide/nickel transport system permease protein
VTGYVVRRVGQAVIVMIGVTLITFTLEHQLPGNIARAIMGPHASPSQLAAFDRQYGLDKSLPIQYFTFLGRLLSGNLGYSFKLNRSVDSIVVHTLPNDVVLVGSSLVLSLLIAVPVGMLQAVRRNRLTDYAATGISFLLYSMPSYLLGLVLIAVFAVNLGWLPAEAPQQSTLAGVLGHPSGLILPIATLTLISFALFSRYMRAAAVENLVQDYVRTARAKGLSQRAIVSRHLLRNSLIPVVTLVGLSLPGVLTAGLIVESLFNFPGLGLDYYNAALNGDFPVEYGITVLVALAVVVGNLLADLAYLVLDPRIRHD